MSLGVAEEGSGSEASDAAGRDGEINGALAMRMLRMSASTIGPARIQGGGGGAPSKGLCAAVVAMATDRGGSEAVSSSARGRRAGVLCHITSLSDRGVNGTIGQAAFSFADRLAQVGCGVWQVLPLTPPDQHASPYASPSAFAIWPGLASSDHEEDAGEGDTEVASWLVENASWADDWSLFDAIRRAHDGAPWTDWPAPLRDREPTALMAWREVQENARSVARSILSQIAVEREWRALRAHATSLGIEIFGDVPFFVAHDSADVWANRNLFQLRSDGSPSVVAGVPPDAFSESGQRWGTVLFDWEEHAADDFAWWKARMARAATLFDLVRIDHFRAIEAAWAIPSEDVDARGGNWQNGPGDRLLDSLLEVVSTSRLVAEDLGIIPPSIVELRRRHGIPGMAVLQFGFDDESSENPHTPSNIREDLVIYTGTHDNDTTMGWAKSSPESRIARARAHSQEGETMADTLTRLALESPAHLAIVPVQDIAQLGGDCRMNTPGTEAGNWRWRLLDSEPNDDDWRRFAAAVEASGRRAR